MLVDRLVLSVCILPIVLNVVLLGSVVQYMLTQPGRLVVSVDRLVLSVGILSIV